MNFRYLIEISYKGTNFHGWQIQPNATTIQETLEKCLSILLKENVCITGSGRTDTGVHCKQQFAHFDSDIDIDSLVFLKKINALLPQDIAVNDILKVSKECHARFSALKRTYHYVISTRKDPFNKGLAWVLYQKPDFETLQEAAKALLKFTDFEAFCKYHSDVNTFECSLYESNWTCNDHFLIYTISANRFLRGMVRIIVGNLIKVGLGKLTIEELEEALSSKNHSLTRNSAPSDGLYLAKVEYPEHLLKGD